MKSLQALLAKPATALVPASLLVMLILAGCHSAFVQATVVNHSGGPIHVFEIDYPTASFGGSEIAPGGQFHSRFKILGNGRPARTHRPRPGPA